MAIPEMYTPKKEPAGELFQSYPRKRFTRGEYDCIALTGIFEGQRVELVEGEILCMSPIGSYHNAVVTACDMTLADLFKKAFHVRTQCSFVVPVETELEPDIAVVPGRWRDYLHKNPDVAALIIEVADSSLEYDTTLKASLYARAGILDYWVIDLKQSVIIVHRSPCAMPDRPLHFGYSDMKTYQAHETIFPLALPETAIPVSELVP
jgi:Uma2 family endonuclease